MSKSYSKAGIVKWIVSFALPIIIALTPVSETFTSPIKWFSVITIFFICLIATDVLPMFVVSVAIPVTYIVFLHVDPKIAFGPWAIEVPWLILGGFIMTMALEKTGLLKRMAYRIILLCGGRFNGILFGFMILGSLTSLIITDNSAKAIMFGALAVGIGRAFDLEFGGRTASALGMVAIASAIGPSYLWYTGSQGNLVPFGIIGAAGYHVPSWTEYVVHMFVPQLIYVFFSIFIIAIFFKPDIELKTKSFFQSELKAFGPMSTEEKKVLVLSLLLIAGIVTSTWHQISLGWLFVYAAIILMLPGMNIVGPKDIKEVNFTFILFVVACLSIGMVAANLGVGKFISDSLYPIISGSMTRFMAGSWALGFLANFAMTPLAAYSTFALPVAEMAATLGVNTTPIMYTFIHSLEQVIFPYEYAPVLIVFGMGLASAKRYMKYNAMRSLLSIICIFLIFTPWWKLIGLL